MNNDKMLAQFGADWVKVRDYIAALKLADVPYTPTFMVRTEKVTGVQANTVKSILDYGLQIGLYRHTGDRNVITFAPVKQKGGYMAEPKRYFWLKLHKDFFQRKEIKRLRKIAGGDTYTIIYLKMLLRSIMSEGKLYFDGLEENFSSELALDLDESEENVQITVTYLLNSGLLEMRSEDEYYLPDTKNSTGCETAVAARVRRHRDKKKALQCNADVTQVKHLCNGEIEKELNTELYKEIEHRDRDITISTTRDKEEEEKSLSPVLNIEIYDLSVEHFGVISSYVKGVLDDLVSEYGSQATIEAVNIAKERGKSSIRYVEGVLKNKRLENGTIRRNGSNRKTETVDWQAEYERVHGKG